MKRKRRLVLLFLAPSALATMFLSCAGTRPPNLGPADGRLAPCPSSPNCVCSDSRDDARWIAPLELALPPAEAWARIPAAVDDLPRTEVITATDDYLHAECSSAVFGFVDDLELHLRPPEGVVAVRSAARKGYSDLGVNRRRVERLRETLREAGVVR